MKKPFKTEEEKHDYQVRCNFLFVIFDLLEDITLPLKDRLHHEFKVHLNRINKSLKIINRIPENLFNEDQIQMFDNDKELLIQLIELEWKATKQGKEKEYLDYINKFFNE